MVKILNKLAIVGAILGVIPVGLPFIQLDTTVVSTSAHMIISIYPWGLFTENNFVIWDIMFLIQFMIPVVLTPVLAVYGSTKPVGGKTIIGVSGFLSLFSGFVWYMLAGSLLGPATWTIPTVGQVKTVGYWSYGFYVAIAAGVVLIISIFLHPSPAYVGYGPEVEEPYKLEEEVPPLSYESAAETMVCPYCGSEIPANSVFCPKCGTKIKDENQEPKTEKNTHEDKEKLI